MVLVPAYSGNPYLRLLSDALTDRGLDVHLLDDIQQIGRAGTQWPDLIHLHWERKWTVQPTWKQAVRQSLALLLGLRRLRRRGVRIIWTVHNLRDHESRHPVLERVAQMALARSVDRLVVHFPEGVGSVRRRLKVRTLPIDVMPHGTYPRVVDCTRSEARSDLGIPTDSIVLASVGFVRPYKRVPRVVEAVRAVDGPLLLIVAGEPKEGEEEQVRRSAGDDARIRLLLGRRTDEELATVLIAADALVLASEDQFTSGSVLLGMGHGCAILSHDSPHVRFLCGAVGAAYFASPGSRSLTELLRTLDRDRLREMGEWNRARAESFTWDHAGAELERTYGSCW